MRKCQHKHVVKILGVGIHFYPLMLIMEMCNGGSLVSHLKKNHPDKNEKLRFSIEVPSNKEKKEVAGCGWSCLSREASLHPS